MSTLPHVDLRTVTVEHLLRTDPSEEASAYLRSLPMAHLFHLLYCQEKEDHNVLRFTDSLFHLFSTILNRVGDGEDQGYDVSSLWAGMAHIGQVYPTPVQSSAPLCQLLISLTTRTASCVEGAPPPSLFLLVCRRLIELGDAVVVSCQDDLTQLLQVAPPFLRQLSAEVQDGPNLLSVRVLRSLLWWCARTLCAVSRPRSYFTLALHFLYRLASSLPMTAVTDPHSKQHLRQCFTVLREFARRSMGATGVTERERAQVLEFTSWFKEGQSEGELPLLSLGEEEGVLAVTVQAYLEGQQEKLSLLEETYNDSLRTLTRTIQGAQTEEERAQGYRTGQYASIERELSSLEDSDGSRTAVLLALLRRLVSLRTELSTHC
ncbi:hypothetical protein ADEAN_000465500 [Angomonas deanei]|uniref:Uncharacterized protein n=1 Tax=Angomonas deanei TaxID=59799 RepID=A0A7G2CDZ4_9TRYP|nr:hypothetical protein ADEAN_000465500 [Angomonas deanei]